MSEDTENDKGKYLSNLIKEIIRSDESEWKSLTSPKVAEFAKDFEKYYQQGNFNMYSASTVGLLRPRTEQMHIYLIVWV